MSIDERVNDRHVGADGSHPVSVQGLVDRLQYHDFFKLFPADIREALLKKASYKTYPAGTTIFFRGDTEAFMGVVISGRLRMSMSATDGRGILLGLVESGEVFGETALIDGLPRTTDAQADTETSIMIIRHVDFTSALKANPEAMYGVIVMLCHRMRIYLDTIDLVALQNLPIRLARLILRLAGDYGVEENGHVIIRAGLNQTSIGQQLATSRESINKQLKVFVAQGIISMHGDEITLLDAAALKNIGG
jgi:CRP/FNR family transcriptional regulator, cyclic AMP receptor protein